MAQDDAGDDASGNGNQNVVSAHLDPMLSTWRCREAMTAVVRDHVLRAAQFEGKVVSTSKTRSACVVVVRLWWAMIVVTVPVVLAIASTVMTAVDVAIVATILSVITTVLLAVAVCIAAIVSVSVAIKVL